MSRGTSWVAVLVATAAVLTACSADPGGSGTDASHAKRSIVRVVEQTTESIGGGWSVYSGPAAEHCERAGAAPGARWSSIVERTAPDGVDPAADVERVEQAWNELEITTERFASGSADPLLGVRGAGGPVTSIGFNAFPQRYSVTAESTCFDGSVAELRGAGSS
ncbi:hypothetical protein [Curtobacterium sp. 260]|uniref:hypothetical protein n=1 Tax=Curtobacterium sp. 260 TaxID=2817748 RepID=UPI0027887047|nr:hypothetical protein [Curtobacterium sp. 260]MDP9737041.1 putative small secreted protein [Curtobacterium sp. 260]